MVLTSCVFTLRGRQEGCQKSVSPYIMFWIIYPVKCSLIRVLNSQYRDDYVKLTHLYWLLIKAEELSLIFSPTSGTNEQSYSGVLWHLWWQPAPVIPAWVSEEHATPCRYVHRAVTRKHPAGCWLGRTWGNGGVYRHRWGVPAASTGRCVLEDECGLSLEFQPFHPVHGWSVWCFHICLQRKTNRTPKISCQGPWSLLAAPSIA